jgi:hypothetical protein
MLSGLAALMKRLVKESRLIYTKSADVSEKPALLSGCCMAISHPSYSWTLNMEATRYPETSAHFKQHAWRYIPEDRTADMGEFCCSLLAGALRLKAAPKSMCGPSLGRFGGSCTEEWGMGALHPYRDS